VQFLQLKPTKTASFAVNVKLHTVTMQVLGSKFSNISKITNRKANNINTLQQSTPNFTPTKTLFTQKMCISAFDRRSLGVGGSVGGQLSKAQSPIEDFLTRLALIGCSLELPW
jgi:hypothetical protein